MREHNARLLAASLLASIPLAATPALATGKERQPPASSEEVPDDPEPIVVNAKRRGEAQVPAETEISEEEIDDYGAQSIRELLGEVAAQVGDPEDAPALLVNGKRVTDPREIARFPPEALQRLEVLPREAAGLYGFAAQRRVVNLVLKNRFDTRTAQGQAAAPIGGGRVAVDLGLQKAAVRGDARWNVDLGFRGESALAETARHRPLPSDRTSGSSLAPSDRILSDTRSETDDESRGDRAFRDILGSNSSLRFNASATQPVGDASANLALRWSRSHSHQRIGLANGKDALALADDAALAQPEFRVGRLAASGRSLLALSTSQSLGLSAGLSGKVVGGDGDLALAFDHGTANVTTERNVDGNDAGQASPVQAATMAERRSSTSDSVTASVNFSRKVIDLGAGPARLQLGANLGISRGRSRYRTGTGVVTDRTGNAARSAQASLNVPLVRKGTGALGGLGDISTSLRLGASSGTGVPLRMRSDFSVSWSPARGIGFNARLGQEDNSPSAEQRNAPRVETHDVRLYDYRTGQVALVTQVSGGNPDLLGGRRSSLAIGGNLRLPSLPQVSLRSDLQIDTVTGGVTALPELTGAVESAFPDRVGRNAQGELVLLDIRPINIASEQRSMLRSGITMTLPLGRAPGAPSRSGSNVEGTSVGSVPGAGAGSARNERATIAQGAPDGARLGAKRRSAARLQFSLSHDWQISNRLVTRSGVPGLDRLAGDGGGQSRHRISLQAMVARQGSSAEATVSWQGHYRTRMESGQDGPGDLVFGSKTTVSVRIELSMERLAGAGGVQGWAKGLRLGLEITNLLNGRQSVRKGDGSLPPGFTRDEIDPVGRAVQLTLRRPL